MVMVRKTGYQGFLLIGLYLSQGVDTEGRSYGSLLASVHSQLQESKCCTLTALYQQTFCTI